VDKVLPVYVFDAYGTLFDVHAAAGRHADRIGPEWLRLSGIWRTKQLEYTFVHAAAGVPASFRALTEQALDFAVADTGAELDPALRGDLLEAYERLDAYGEAGEVLGELRKAGAKTAILSNGDPDMLETMVSSAGLAESFDAVISVSEARVFKPDMRVYQLACDRFQVAAAEVSFQSSNRWDIAGASVFGFRTVWINRAGRPDEYPGLAPAHVAGDLRALLRL